MSQYRWTLNGGRLQNQSCYKNSEINWIFLPGGPGLGSESLADLTQLLRDKIPGAIWHFDFPNDGSNILDNKPISNWRSSLIQAITSLEKVVLVAHSSSGMYAQTMPELEKLLYGLVLIGSAPDASWQKIFEKYCEKNPDAMITKTEKEYIQNPNNETLRKLLIVSAKNCFVTEKSLKKGKKLFKRIPINSVASDQALKSFDPKKYQATWIPQIINTLIIAGSLDHITPLTLFQKNKKYQRKNISLQEISGAGHYPWFENPDEVVDVFQEFSRKLYENIEG